MPKLVDKLKNIKPKVKSNTTVWAGPEDSSPNGGISQSMLNRFLGCRERFRLRYIEGLTPADSFTRAAEYGQCWHICEEALAANKDWHPELMAYASDLCRRYPMQQEEIEKWFNVCKVQFPLYVDYWSKHPDNLKRTPLMQEQVFHVPYTLPSGRVVYLRGKFDSVDLIGTGKQAGVYLMENKSKGTIDVQSLQRQLTFDLQTMMYLVALKIDQVTPMGFLGAVQDCSTGRLGGNNAIPIKGVRYNVIRRPLSGGRGTISRHEATKGAKCPKCKGESEVGTQSGGISKCPKCEGDGRIGAKAAETYQHYYDRLGGIIKEDCDSDDPSRNQYWFSRWKVEVSQADVEAFKQQFLNPILEQLCDWYEWLTTGDPWNTRLIDRSPGDPPPVSETPENHYHYRHPFGTYNVLDEGGSTELDEYLSSGSEAGLTRDVQLFRELQ